MLDRLALPTLPVLGGRVILRDSFRQTAELTQTQRNLLAELGIPRPRRS